MDKLVFIDTEVGVTDHKVHDIGAVGPRGLVLHTSHTDDLIDFIKDAHFVCGHNIIHHDLVYLRPALEGRVHLRAIDTLYLSPLLFPRRPYHALLKDDKLQVDELNNPVNDCLKAQLLFNDEVQAFRQLPEKLQEIYYHLLHEVPEFQGFFEYLDYEPPVQLNRLLFGWLKREDYGIGQFFEGEICAHADLEGMIRQYPVELAYALSLIHTGDSLSIVPPWTLKHYPKIYNLITLLKNHPCEEGCPYCEEKLNAVAALHKFFGYDSFRTYKGEPLQEKAVQAAIHGKSMVVVFPTGGGKSITFQIPALLAGENSQGLTVVISPLQSLMKDQVDNLKNAGIERAVTINGLLSPIERADAFRRVAEGSVSLLYISPEMLRSRTVERMLMMRNVVRFVIDEAHCFSSWGHDFRIDYLYIGDFIRKLQQNKANGLPIAVSCFTATAKQKVISDIRDYFKEKLDLDLEIYASTAARENLTYTVLYKETEEEKYYELRNLIERKNCPTIVYVSRTRQTIELARKLTADGFPAKPFNGKMSPNDKVDNQEAFIRNEFKIIVATSAFGMGVDKSDIGLVVHFDISDSLENYIQESGRAGRDQRIHADCYVLYNDSDLDKHFILLNQTKLSLSEIQQVWQGIKRLSGNRKRIFCSPLEIARMAGWDSNVSDVETRVKTAIASLENAGYIRRGNNMPRVYATGIQARNVEEAARRITNSRLLTSDTQRSYALHIIKNLMSARTRERSADDEAESRVDYLADILGITKTEVIETVNLLRQEGLLADTQDMSAYLPADATLKRTQQVFERYALLEKFILNQIAEDGIVEFNLKELNASAEAAGVPYTSVRNIRTILYFLCVKQYIRKEEYKGTSHVKIASLLTVRQTRERFDKRLMLCRFIIDEFFRISDAQTAREAAEGHAPSHHRQKLISFSLVGLFEQYRKTALLQNITQDDVQDALLYLTTIGAIRLEGGFLVLYNGLEINRLEMDNRIRYKVEDYASLRQYYKQKVQQIHIVGEFANMMVKDYQAALQFVNDYFQLDYRSFINRYFKNGKADLLDRNMTTQRYEKLFGCLSPQQKAIIDDDESKHIVVVAGPGSGKTRVLVHKLAAMLTLEDVKHEQLLMVTFSRAAATEFKMRLTELIGNAANFVEIKTFHSYCFDLMGRIGNLEDSGNVVRNAVQMIGQGEVEPERIAKSVMVIDEAQDMDEDEYHLVQALMQVNDDMRVIAVGDDDQNIFEFRGSDSRYMRALITDYEARMYELVENFRSRQNIVRFSNRFARLMSRRLKNRDIVAVTPEAGQVELTRYESRNMEEPLIKEVVNRRCTGSVCIMTSTNDEVFRLLGLLLKKGIPAKLIQSTDGFALYNLAEIRYFLKKLHITSHPGEITDTTLSPVITDEEWSQAKAQLQKEYAGSSALPNCLHMLDIFESTSVRKYRSDLEDFIHESNYEDFYLEEKGAVYVSTIHKTKGREFDHVYLMLNHIQHVQDTDLRKLYVGMTRARHSLSIHYCDTPVMDQIQAPFALRNLDSIAYPEPAEIALQLTHKDVYLDYFKDKKRLIFKLRSGSPLQLGYDGLQAGLPGETVNVLAFSKSFISRLQALCAKGYLPVRASVRFVVAWKAEDDETETAVLLPNLYLRKS